MPWHEDDNINLGIPDPKERKRCWRFTVFDKSALQAGDALYKELNAAYCVVGAEICPKTKRPHHQGYVRFSEGKSAWAVDKLLQGRAMIFWATAKKCDAANTKYCSKDGNLVYTCGKVPKQGDRTDLQYLKDLVAEGKGMRQLIDDPLISDAALKIAPVIFAYKEKRREWEPDVRWIWGPAGCGKSTYAKAALPNAYLIENKGREGGTKWWQGYDAHEDVIIDDFRGNFCPFTELLGILGPSAFVVENKGGSRQLLARRIIVTSALPPEKCYRAETLGNERIDQLLRRINVVYEMKHRPGAVARQPIRVELTPETTAPAALYGSVKPSGELLCNTEEKTPFGVVPPGPTAPTVESSSTEVTVINGLHPDSCRDPMEQSYDSILEEICQGIVIDEPDG